MLARYYPAVVEAIETETEISQSLLMMVRWRRSMVICVVLFNPLLGNLQAPLSVRILAAALGYTVTELLQVVA